MSKSHSDHLKIEEETPLRSERHANLRVVCAFVTDAMDSAVHSSGTLEYNEVCALARRAYELGCRTAQQRGFEQWTPDEISGIRARAMVDGITGCRDPRLAITPKDKGPRPYSVSTREMLDDYVRKIYGPLARKAMLDAVLYGHKRVIGMDFGFDDKSETGNKHDSDCAVHNEPASAPGPCDCGVEAERTTSVEKDWDTSPKVGYGVDDHEGREAQRKSDAARIAAVMGWKD